MSTYKLSEKCWLYEHERIMEIMKTSEKTALRDYFHLSPISNAINSICFQNNSRSGKTRFSIPAVECMHEPYKHWQFG
jgi:hypothetical protein